jgi:hypothetical protein
VIEVLFGGFQASGLKVNLTSLILLVDSCNKVGNWGGFGKPASPRLQLLWFPTVGAGRAGAGAPTGLSSGL